MSKKYANVRGGSRPDPKSIANRNWGKPLGFQDKMVHGWHCPDKDRDVPDCCYEYLDRNQAVAAFTWWDTNPFQTTYGASKKPVYSGLYEKLKIKTKTVRDHEVCNSDCCYAYSPSGHMHDTETEEYRCGKKDCHNCPHRRTYCVGRAPAHYHSHTEYSV